VEFHGPGGNGEASIAMSDVNLNLTTAGMRDGRLLTLTVTLNT